MPGRSRRIAAVALMGAMACLALSGSAGPEKPPQKMMEMPLLFAEDFERDAAARWEPTDPNAWRIVAQGENRVFSQFQQSKYEPPVRSPFNRALRKDTVVGDFVLEARVQSTTKDYPHRSLCLMFGYQNPAHFYYVHLGKQADAHANSIFLVNDAPRVSIAKTRTDGTPWDDAWHTVRIARRVKSGTIQVYFDDMRTPVMTAEDKTFAWGRVGIGSFDDTGNFDDVRLWGVRAKPPQQESR